MKTLPGLPASIVLGIQNAHPHSSVVSGVALLWCDALGYGESGTYSANCYSDTWQGRITFRVEGPGRMTLDNIRAETEKIVEKGNYEYRIYQVVMYPLFLYGFLLLSALVWLAARAFRFVKNG
jgi:hypothetical protein